MPHYISTRLLQPLIIKFNFLFFSSRMNLHTLYRLYLWTSKVFLFINGLASPLIIDRYHSQTFDNCIFPLYSEIGYFAFHPKIHFIFITKFPDRDVQAFYANKLSYHCCSFFPKRSIAI